MIARVRDCLQDALSRLMGEPLEGTMAYVRCLPREVLRDLAEQPTLVVPGWGVKVVLGSDEEGANAIATDQAVELREAKKGGVLLLVDPSEAGAGMDGIYNAVREIPEGELLRAAQQAARKTISDKRIRSFLEVACKRARRLGGRRSVSPWDVFELYASCSDDLSSAGLAITQLGLWPVDSSQTIEELHVEAAAQMVERLLLVRGAENTVHSRIAGLLLPEEAEEQRRGLEQFLLEHAASPWRETVLDACNDQYRSLWLGPLLPGFIEPSLRQINLDPWRGRRDQQLVRWSGLVRHADEDVPYLHLVAQDGRPPKLEVRWRTLPSGLPPGVTSYVVSILTGNDEELVAKTVGHTGKASEKCVFSGEDLEDLCEEGGIWHAVVCVHPVSESPESGVESPLCPRTEPFIITSEIGPSSEISSQTVGKIYRALVEGALLLPREDFSQADTASCIEDRKNFVCFRSGTHSFRVFRPQLVCIVEEHWRERDYELGRWSIVVREDGSLAEPVTFHSVPTSELPEPVCSRLEKETRNLARKAVERRCGFVGMLYGDHIDPAEYVKAWADALEHGRSELALANTVEVRDQQGQTKGLIVLPSHPVRVAWHHAYDALAACAHFDDGLNQKKALEALKVLDGSYFPAFLPGLRENEAFVFGDVLGFHAVAMLSTANRN